MLFIQLNFRIRRRENVQEMLLPIIESASIKMKVKVCGDASSGQGHLVRPGGQIET